MAKSRANLTLDPNTHEKAKSVYDNFSQRVEELIQADLDVSQMEDVNMVKDEINNLEEEKGELVEEKEELEKKIQQVESELNTARATLKRLEREEADESDGLATFKENCSEGTFPNEWRKPDDIPSFWIDETGKNREELFRIYENNGEES